MALATYSDLQAELLAYMARSDAIIVARFPTFMLGAEQRIYYGYGESETDALHSDALRCALMETSPTAITITAGTGSLPADFLEQRALYITGTSQTQPDYEPPQRYFSETLNSTWSEPVTYTIAGSTLYVAGSFSGTVNLIYYKKFPALAVAADTHALVAAYPTVWLNALLIEAYDWARNADGVQRSLAKLSSAIDGLNGTAAESHYGGPSQMTMRIDAIG